MSDLLLLFLKIQECNFFLIFLAKLSMFKTCPTHFLVFFLIDLHFRKLLILLSDFEMLFQVERSTLVSLTRYKWWAYRSCGIQIFPLTFLSGLYVLLQTWINTEILKVKSYGILIRLNRFIHFTSSINQPLLVRLPLKIWLYFR